ncbi:MAG: chemotaxis protein CheD [Phycisphaerales bacterium]|nr:chemotaxis protein CheD [Phycisphaerales bacterium]
MAGTKTNTHTIGIAGVKVVKSPEKIRTVLGSCIGVALYDRVAKIGGMAHVMLPSSSLGKGDKGKFADTAVDWLLDDVLKAGADKKRVTAKITGGASMFGTQVDSGIGDKNAKAVKDRLSHHSVRLAAEDIGGTKGRKMQLDPGTGQVEVQVIGADPKVI